MNPTDQLIYGRPAHEKVSPPQKTDRSERKEQGHFANWLLLQNDKERKIPWVWHSTAHRSKATPGTPDFLVGINGKWICLEFKRDYSELLRPSQQQFYEACRAQGLPYHVVYSCEEAIDLVQKYDSL